MRRMRVSMLGLMVLVMVSGLGLAALRTHSMWWVSGLFTLTVVLVALACLLAVVRAGRERGAAAGFAIFGGLYLLIVFGIGPQSHGVQIPALLLRPVIDALQQPIIDQARAMEEVTKHDTHQRYQSRDHFGYSEGYDFEDSVVLTHNSDNTPLPHPLVIHSINQVDIRRKLHSLAAIAVGLVGAGLGVLCTPIRTDGDSAATGAN